MDAKQLMEKKCPDEYNTMLIKAMEMVFTDLLVHSLDDILWQSPTTNKEEQCVTYRDAVIALSGSVEKEWLKNELIKDVKSFEDYNKKKI